MSKSSIEWTDETWNPVRGCSRVSAGCENCYAERQAARHAGPGRPYEGLVRTVNGHPVWTGKVRVVPEKLEEPLRWRKPRRVFVNSMSDLFHEDVPDAFIDQAFAIMVASPRHTYQILTKRPRRMRDYLLRLTEAGAGDRLSDAVAVLGWDEDSVVAIANIVNGWSWPGGRPPDGRPLDGTRPYWPLGHVWLGVSVEDQETADERIPLLLETPAAVRFVSYEPALAPVDFPWWVTCPTCKGSMSVPAMGGGSPCPTCLNHQGAVPGVHWLIVGGESGPGARPFDVAWARSTVEQCRAAGVPVFVKQDSGPKPGKQGRIPDELWIREWPDARS